MKITGKPYSGKPNVRFDEGELEIELLATTPALYSTNHRRCFFMTRSSILYMLIHPTSTMVYPRVLNPGEKMRHNGKRRCGVVSSRILLPIKSPKYFFTLIIFLCFLLCALQTDQARAGSSQRNPVGLEERTSEALVIDPLNPNTLYAAAASGEGHRLGWRSKLICIQHGVCRRSCICLSCSSDQPDIPYAGT